MIVGFHGHSQEKGNGRIFVQPRESEEKAIPDVAIFRIFVPCIFMSVALLYSSAPSGHRVSWTAG
jgi:hypothetical protein